MLDLNGIILLKKYLAERNAGTIHMHDTCGGQYFSLDVPDEKTELLIKKFCDERNIKVIFSDDRLGFTIL